MRPTVRVFATLVLLSLCSIAARAQTERIRDFHSDIHLLDDGTLLVKKP